MSYVDPKLREQFESLPIQLKDTILEQNVELHTLTDLMKCLETLIRENDSPEQKPV